MTESRHECENLAMSALDKPKILPRLRSMSWDQWGISLSLLCAIHCALTPLALIFLPVMIGKTYDGPGFHWVLALLIVPIGLRAFITGYRHHKRTRVFFLGLPGLVIVGIIPLVFSKSLLPWQESILMIVGSSLLISAHWYNRRSCSCEIHGGHQ